MVAITDKQAESGIGGKFTDQNSVRYVSSTLDLPPSLQCSTEPPLPRIHLFNHPSGRRFLDRALPPSVRLSHF